MTQRNPRAKGLHHQRFAKKAKPEEEGKPDGDRKFSTQKKRCVRRGHRRGMPKRGRLKLPSQGVYHPEKVPKGGGGHGKEDESGRTPSEG